MAHTHGLEKDPQMWSFYTLFLKMPARCVVRGCSNIPGSGISQIHRFPKDKIYVRRIWLRFVTDTRSDFVCTEYIVQYVSNTQTNHSVQYLLQLVMVCAPSCNPLLPPFSLWPPSFSSYSFEACDVVIVEEIMEILQWFMQVSASILRCTLKIVRAPGGLWIIYSKY